MDFKKRLTINIGISSAIFVLMLASFFFIGGDIAARAEKIKQLRGEINFRSQANQSLALLRRDAQKASAYVSVLDDILLSRDQLLDFPRQIEKLAFQDNVSFSFGFGAETPKNGADFGAINFSASSAGSFDNLVIFLKHIENSGYFMKIESFDLQRKERDFQGSFSGKIFSF
ncbi:hypothetical protein HZB06_02685 [Candidatus Wolfebacteria bacterium]|nr:hypothetical protein [Candidatus Wolfebacteria bacterium]